MAADTSPPKASSEQLLIVTWTLFGTATAFFIARIAVRLKFSSRVFVDDGFAFFALLCLLANAILLTIMLPSMYTTIKMQKLASQFGKRQNVFDTIGYYMKLQFSQTIIYWTCLWTVKASFLAFFKRLTNNLKAHVITWWIIVVITALAYAGCIISYPISCSSFFPLACEHERNVTLALLSLRFSTAMDILTDLLIIALPMSLAMRVKLPWRTRIALCGIFALGGFIILFSVVRIIMTNMKDKRPEVSWLNLWSAVEASVACVVCNLAPFKVLFSGSIRTYSSNPYRYNQHYAREGKQSDSHELSSSGRSHQSGYPTPYPTPYPNRPENPLGANSFSQPRRYPRRGLQTHVTADREGADFGHRVRNGAIVVTREVDRREIPADQVTLNTEAGDHSGSEKMRTMWTDRHSSESVEIILPMQKTHSK